MLRLLRPWLTVAALAVAGLAPLRGDDPRDKPPPKLSADEEKILDLTNAAREKEKLAPLKLNPVLTEVARAHSANMARRGEMNHVLDGKKPSDRVKAAGYDYAWVGENLAETDGDTPAVIFKRWMESPHHKENILRDTFTEIGVGIARNEKGEIYYTQVFGSPKKKRDE
jgi:uncharacterized protein YkwD